MEQYDLVILGAGSGNSIIGPAMDDWRIALSDAIGKAPARRACRRPRRVRRSDDVASEMSAMLSNLIWGLIARSFFLLQMLSNISFKIID